MPSSSTGFTGTEIVTRVVNFIGNTTNAFQTYVEQTLPLAEFRFCKIHPWKFLYKQNLPLACVSGTNEYELSIGNIGFYMAAEDVHTIFDSTNGLVLSKQDLKDIRRLDPKVDDGSATDDLTHWAPLSDNKILVYPKVFQAVTLRIDGWITPGALTTLSNYPTIPYKYQEAFIEYVIAMALDRDNDDRAAGKKSEALALIRQDILNDMRGSGDVDNPRVRSWNESNMDGTGSDMESAYLNWLFR